MNRRINLTLGAAAAGLLGSAFLPAAVAFADASDPFTLFGTDVMTTVSPTELATLDAAVNADPALASALEAVVTSGDVPGGANGVFPAADDAFANLLPADATTAQINEAASLDGILYGGYSGGGGTLAGDPTLAATLAADDSTGTFPDAPGTDAFTIGNFTFDPYTTSGTEGFDPVTQGTGTAPYFETGAVNGQNFEVFGPASGTTPAAELGTITTNENVTSLFGITNTGFDVTGGTAVGATALPTDGTIFDVTNFGGGFENVYADVPGVAGAMGTATDTFVTPFGDYDLSSMVSAFDLSALDPGAAFGLGADAGTAAADAVSGVDPLAFLGL